jgi:hypothetical protein
MAQAMSHVDRQRRRDAQAEQSPRQRGNRYLAGELGSSMTMELA